MRYVIVIGFIRSDVFRLVTSDNIFWCRILCMSKCCEMCGLSFGYWCTANRRKADGLPRSVISRFYMSNEMKLSTISPVGAVIINSSIVMAANRSLPSQYLWLRNGSISYFSCPLIIQEFVELFVYVWHEVRYPYKLSNRVPTGRSWSVRDPTHEIILHCW